MKELKPFSNRYGKGALRPSSPEYSFSRGIIGGRWAPFSCGTAPLTFFPETHAEEYDNIIIIIMLLHFWSDSFVQGITQMLNARNGDQKTLANFRKN